jgi:SPP1 family predicted phage head-tail adaptor
MKCCDINAGMLRTRVFIEKKTRVDDGMGGATETWAENPKGGVWAAVQNLAGTERWEASRMHPGNLIRLTLRFRGDSAGAPYWTSVDHRVKIRGRIYGILAIMDVEMMQQWLKMDLFESQPS